MMGAEELQGPKTLNTKAGDLRGVPPRGGRARARGLAFTLPKFTLRTRHTLEPLSWHWSHWPGRLVNRGCVCLFSKGSNPEPLRCQKSQPFKLPKLTARGRAFRSSTWRDALGCLGSRGREYRGTSLIRKRRPHKPAPTDTCTHLHVPLPPQPMRSNRPHHLT